MIAQSTEVLSEKFCKLKYDLAMANSQKSSSKNLKQIVKQLDTLLSNIVIERSENGKHNSIPFLSCFYDQTPMNINAVIRREAQNDTILFQNGKWYICKDLHPDTEINLLCIENLPNPTNKQVKKEIDILKKRYTYQFGNELASKKRKLYFVKEDNLYYAAIESKRIPSFSILSNNEVINYATCLKAILKASGIEATYDDIIGKYLHVTIDEHSLMYRNNCNTIAGRKVVTTFISQNNINASYIVDELLRERFIISVDKKGNVGLLTAIALTGESNYTPVHVRLRMPSMPYEETRVQMSWKDFIGNTVSIVKVDIY